MFVPAFVPALAVGEEGGVAGGVGGCGSPPTSATLLGSEKTPAPERRGPRPDLLNKDRCESDRSAS